jgi:hypothetical protein
MFEQRSLVTVWSFVFYADGLQHGKCAAASCGWFVSLRAKVWGNDG